MPGKTVYIVSEDRAVRDSLARLVVAEGLNPEVLSSLEVWLKASGRNLQAVWCWTPWQVTRSS